MNLLHAAHAHGFVGSWLTGWAAYSPADRRRFVDELVAGQGPRWVAARADPVLARAAHDLIAKITRVPKNASDKPNQDVVLERVEIFRA